MSGSENFRSADNVSVTAVETKAPSNALDEVLDFCSQTVQHPEARIRQTGTVLQGIVVGGIKDIPNELMNHPLETCGKVAVAAGFGIGAGALIGLEIPIVTGITIGAGVTMLGIGMLDSIKRMSSSKELQGALHKVWKSDDFYTQMQANDRAEKVLGPEAFNWGVTLPVGLVSGNFAAKMVSAKLLSGKPAVIPVDTPEIVATEQTAPAECNIDRTIRALDRDYPIDYDFPLSYEPVVSNTNTHQSSSPLAARMAKIREHGEKVQNMTPAEKSDYYAALDARQAVLDEKWKPWSDAYTDWMSAYIRDDLTGMEAARNRMSTAWPNDEPVVSAESSIDLAIRAIDRDYPIEYEDDIPLDMFYQEEPVVSNVSEKGPSPSSIHYGIGLNRAIQMMSPRLHRQEAEAALEAYAKINATKPSDIYTHLKNLSAEQVETILAMHKSAEGFEIDIIPEICGMMSHGAYHFKPRGYERALADFRTVKGHLDGYAGTGKDLIRATSQVFNTLLWNHPRRRAVNTDCNYVRSLYDQITKLDDLQK